MPFVCVADACRRLGIDAKTLHRWLADAQLPLHSHPRDGRKKGVSSEHLELLARLHQRSLAPLSPQPPAPVVGGLPPLPTALLDLPEQMGALQAQIAALQQQVAALTHLLEQHAYPAARAKPPRVAKRSSQHAKAPHVRSFASARAKPPRKPTHVLPRVEYASRGRYVVICPKEGVLPLEPETQEWFAWLTTHRSFRFVGQCGHLTAHRELQGVSRAVWRAHRQIRNHSYNLHLGKTQELTIAVLEQAAAALQAHLT